MFYNSYSIPFTKNNYNIIIVTTSFKIAGKINNYSQTPIFFWWLGFAQCTEVHCKSAHR